MHTIKVKKMTKSFRHNFPCYNTGFLTQGMFQVSYSVLSVKYKTITGENTNPYNKVRKFVNNSTYIYPHQLKNMCLPNYTIKP